MSNGNTKKKGNGCLIAIIVVCVIFFIITILGILAAIAIPGYFQYIKSSKTAEAKMNLKALSDGAAAYYEANKQYPIAVTPVRLGPVVDSTTIGIKHVPNEEDYVDTWKQLLFRLPTPSYFTYYYISDGKSFKAMASASLAEECDSVFEITGTIVSDEPFITPIISLYDTKTDCNAISLPSSE